jgi:dihydrofolate reductase
MRKVILYISMTLDGMIADLSDGLSFLEPYDGLTWVKDSYDALLFKTDTLLIGRSTYEVIQSFDIPWPYPDHQCYVYGQKKMSSEVATFIHEDATSHVTRLKQHHGKDIWLVGGGKLIQSLLESKMIDEMIITIIPVVLGSGIPLFSSSYSKRFFDLVDTKTGSGLVMLTYHKQID